MDFFLKLAFLFFIGSVTGWCMEVLFRRFISSSNPERKWINPGFCTGPYLPLYGFGLCILYLIALLENINIISNPVWNKVFLFFTMALCMTVIEYIAGIISLKIYKVRLWDYRNEKWNIQGIICPKFSLIWAALGAVYYFLIHPYILSAVDWLSHNWMFSFVIGLFFGIFIVDVVNSAQIVSKLKKYAEENNVIVKYEEIKASIRRYYERTAQKYNFFKPFHSDISLSEHLRDVFDTLEKRIRNIKE